MPTGLAPDAAVEGGIPQQSRRARLWHVAVGEPALAPLSIAHGLAGVADAFVAVSLAGSLFFNLSPDASRQQVLLYLIVTMSPLAVLAPLIGPAVDRFRRRPRLLATVCFVFRALFCLALAGSLYRLSFYGFALGLLVIGKASGIVKQAMVPTLVLDHSQLVRANARIARLGAVTGAIGGAIAVAVLDDASAQWVLRCAAVVFVGAAIAASRAKPPEQPERVLTEVEYAELHRPTMVVGSIGMMAIRAAVGFFVFTLAFTLRRASEPIWVYGVAVVVYSAGSFVGTLVAPALRRRFQDQQLIAIALGVPAVPTLIGILGVSRPLLLVIAALIGASTTVGRHGFDSLLQHRAPAASRGRAAARYETRFQLVWALGGVLATPIAFPAEVSMAVLTALYVPALVVFLRASNAARSFEQRSALDVAGRASERIISAEECLDGGAPRLAVIEAGAAVDLMRVADPGVAAHPDFVRLDGLRRAALQDGADVVADDGVRAIALARAVISSLPAPTTT
ncbi:MAG TPA: MFS transporter [Ilumatobacteraceae bacterium]